MAEIKAFIFNYFYENTYILYDETHECVIIDPGCSNSSENGELDKFIRVKELKPVHLLNTHCHIDHIFGNLYVSEKYNLPLETSVEEVETLRYADISADRFGILRVHSPEPGVFLKEGDIVTFGNTKLEVLFVPGHSIGHIAFYCRESEFIIGGDVLFRESIGRTDLPGGNFETLMKSIHDKIMPLGDKVCVYSGHGPVTTVGYERQHNPFILEQKWDQ